MEITKHLYRVAIFSFHPGCFEEALRKMNSIINRIAILFLMAIVAGCGGSGAFTSSSSSATSSTGSGGTTGQPSISLALTDSSGASTTSISVDSPGTVKATVVDENGSPVAGAVVTFTATLATFNPTSGSVLTDSSGVATVTLVGGTTTGADTITADATINTTSASATKGYTVAAPSISLSSLTIATSPLSANGTTSLTITVQDGTGAPYTTPVDIAFSSNCSAIGKATIGSPITTINGVATSNYLDQGCANTDTVTASLTVGGTSISKTASIVVNPASAGSIQFVSASPQGIALKGTGGFGLQETSTVTFKVVDSAGNPVSGVPVDFTLSTAVGGITYLPTSATTDAQGNVTTVVSSGTVATAVRVIATVTGSTPLLSTQSDQMTITTGIPAQDNFSLSVSKFNIEGWEYNNEASVFTVNVSDHFRNPAPDGTAINFISEGAQVGSACELGGNPVNCEAGGACHTLGGYCRVVFTSNDLRPYNGRVTVLAYGIGEEGFTDMDGDGYVSSNAERVDSNGVSTDMPEAWVDYNENGVRDSGEPFIDFDKNGSYDAADTYYNGVLCQSGGAWCSPASNSINVRQRAVIVLSSTSAVIKGSTDPAAATDPDVFNSFSGTIALDPCVTGSKWSANDSPTTVLIQVTDIHGNAMAGGSTITATTTNGKITISPASPILDSTECVSGDTNLNYGCPASAPHSTQNATLFFLQITSDATQSGTSAPYSCGDSGGSSGLLTISVTTPSPHQVTTSKFFTVTD